MNSFASRRWPPERLLIALALVAGPVVSGLGCTGPSAGTASVSAASSVSEPTYGPAVKFDKSPPLRLIKPPPPSAAVSREVPLHRLDVLRQRARPSPNAEDPLARLSQLGALAP